MGFDPITVGIGAAALGGSWYSSKRGSEKAARAQESAAEKATDVELEMFYQSREDLAPWREAGEWALGTPAGYYDTEGKYLGIEKPTDQPEAQYREATGLAGMIAAGPGEFKESPGYQFRLAEGEKAIGRGMAARGLGSSGAALKAITRYGQDYATNEYDKFLSRYYQSLTPYQSMAGIGQTSAAQTGQMGMQAGQSVAGNILYGGAAKASGYVGEAQAINQGIGNLLNIGAYGGWFDKPQ